MCVSSGHHICLLCMLLYGWQAKVEAANVPSGVPELHGAEPVSEYSGVDKNETELYLTEKDYFLTKLMKKYGNGEEMSYEGFEHLLHHLGLGGTIKFDHEVSCHKAENSSEFLQLHLHHNHSADMKSVSKYCDDEHKDHEHVHSADEHDHIHSHDGHESEHIHEDHEHTEDHNHDHDHTEEHNHDLENTEDHSHDHEHPGEHDHEHTEDHNHDHEHTGEHDHEHTEEHNETKSHSHDHNEHIKGSKEDDHKHDHDHDHHVHKRDTGDNECLPANVMLRLVHIDKPNSLTKDMFKELCPSLIYQIDADTCHSFHSESDHGVFHQHDDGNHADHDSYHGNHDHDHHEHDHDHHEHEHSTGKIDLSKVPPKVWGFSSIAVIIISLVGLLGVAVIPIMQKVFYNHMLQFLVALAVGALSGDALLHLLPHAIAGGHDHGQDGHDDSSGGHSHDSGPIYKGLCGLLGIYFFFFTERVLTIFTEYKRKKKQTKNRKKFMKDEELVKVGEKLANSECDGMMMSIHPNKALRGYADEAHSEHCTISFENTTTISHEHGQRHEETCVDGDENTSMIGSNNSSPKPHGHRHGHGHSHGVDGVPDSVASVAWMVILGDGIHNFSDGLAIGAAFVNSITGGFSTSIAVFCHELPHEIGDFAMLLRAGMSPKQAIIYNCLSSILCFVGMLIGVAVGNLAGASLWIFAMVGGMFLYIALVDMLPELSSVETKKGEHPLCHLLLQFIGMCIGAGIMLTIALYEDDLRTMLD